MLQYTKALFNVVLFMAFMFVRSLPIYTSKFTSFHFRFNVLWPVYFHLSDFFFYRNIIYDLRLFYLHSLFHDIKWGIKQGLGVVVGLCNHHWAFLTLKSLN